MQLRLVPKIVVIILFCIINNVIFDFFFLLFVVKSTYVVFSLTAADNRGSEKNYFMWVTIIIIQSDV